MINESRPTKTVEIGNLTGRGGGRGGRGGSSGGGSGVMLATHTDVDVYVKM